MGTTESIFASTEEVPGPTAPRSQPSIDRDSNVPRTSPHDVPASSSAAAAVSSSRRRPRSSPAVVPHTPTQLPTQSQKSSFQLNGMVLGMSKSGKRTLLQRLEGKEPDFLKTATHHPNEEREASAVTVAKAPYQPSLHHFPKFHHDESIQLHVHAIKKMNTKTHSGCADGNDDYNNADHHIYHFYVILINPRHDRVKLQKYITKRLHDIVRLQGYNDQKTSHDSSSSISEVAANRPFCVSLLRNFADRIQGLPPSDSTIQISDLTMWTMEVLGEYPQIMENVRIPPLLQCIDTSLLNCYGLSALHHFIYQSYVQTKQYLVQQELLRIEEAIVTSRHEATSYVVPYDEYVENIEQILQGSTASTSTTIPSSNNSAGSTSIGRSTNRDDETAHTGAANGNTTGSRTNRRRIINSQPVPALHAQEKNANMARPSNPRRDRNELSYPMEQPRSRTMSGDTSTSTIPSVQQSLDHAKDALEAFFESDSDNDDDIDDDDEEDGERANVFKKENEKGDDDSDDDGDFYMDESNGDKEGVARSSAGTDQNSQKENPTNATLADNVPESISPDDGSPQSKVRGGGAASPSSAESTELDHAPRKRLDTATEVYIEDDATDQEARDARIKPLDSVGKDDDDESDFFVEEGDTASDVGNTELDHAPRKRPDTATEVYVEDDTTDQEAHNARIKPLDSVGKDDDDESDFFVEEGDTASDVGNTEESNDKEALLKKNGTKASHTDIATSVPDESLSDNISNPNNDSDAVHQKVVNRTDTESIAPITKVDVSPVLPTDQISDAARAALELARRDFERMLSEQHSQVAETHEKETISDASPKKSKKDKHKKKNSTKEGKKSKRHDL